MKNNDENLIKNDANRPKAEESKLLAFVVKHNTVISMSLVIVIILLWAVIKMNTIQKRAHSEKQHLTEIYETRLDSLTISSMELTAKVLSWAVRGEMLRQNLDQVNQFFNSFVQEPGINKIQLIDPVSAKIVLSTDKKDEGAIIEDTLILQAERIYNTTGENHTKIISPVMGLSTRIGVLVIEINK